MRAINAGKLRDGGVLEFTFKMEEYLSSHSSQTLLNGRPTERTAAVEELVRELNRQANRWERARVRG
jgi:hypothetical protein